eukprot:s335_g7.t1
MHGFSREENFEPDELQQEVLERLHYLAILAGDRGQEGPLPSEEASLREMLQGRTEYHAPDSPIALAPFNLERISIPESLEGSPEAIRLLDGDARQYLEVPQRMLSEDTPVEPIKPYWDPRLLKDQRAYKSLVVKLDRLKYLRYTLSPCAEAGVFFVYKSDRKKIRMILDSRRANQMFRAPPGVELCSAEGFSRLEVVVPESHHPGSPEFAKDLEGFGLYFGLSDIKDCFHRLRIPSWLSKYFALKPVPCEWVGLDGTELEGKRLQRGDTIYPMAGSLPMGFSWSLYFAQRISELQMLKIPTLENSASMTDRGHPAVFRAPVPAGEREASHYVYVDNLGVISPHQAIVKSALEEMKGLFEAEGLILHPGEIHHEQVKALGCELQGDILATRVTPKRFHKVRQSLRAVLRRKKVSGRVLEVVIGHATFCSLTCRPLLSIFNSVYKYIKAEYYAPASLWASVREELESFIGGMIFLQSDWWRKWNPLVSCSDSSLSGYGVSTSYWPPEAVASAGRIMERSRFRKLGAHSARDSALTSAGFVKDEVTGLWRDRAIGDEEYLQLAGWSLNKDFQEIPAYLLKRELWTPRLWGRWDFHENILVLEGRALVKSLKRIALTKFGCHIRQLLLVDNLSVALSFDRCRCRDFKLLRQIRRFCAYLLARNISASIRWVPSELNNSDIPSRYHSDEPSKLLTDQIPDARKPSLPAPDPKRDLMTPKLSDQSFNLMDVSLLGLDRRQKRARDQSPSDSTSATESGQERVSKKKKLERTVRRRAKALVDAGMDFRGEEAISFLEHRAVSAQTSKQYQIALRDFKDFATPRGLDWKDATSLDRLLVTHLNMMYFQGHQAYRADRLLAAVMHEHPEYGRAGSQKIPRSWRALKGFRKLCPGKSRKAYPLAVWAAVAVHLKANGYLRMAIFLLMALSSYSRPSELLRARVMSLVRPATGVTQSWSLLLSPEERPERSKTGEFDTSVLLDSPWLHPWALKLFPLLKQNHPEACLWDFTYADYSDQIRAATKDLSLDLTPYQTRHSGPSIDRARRYRDAMDVQKRGHWRSQKSTARYEKSARLAATWDALPASLKVHCQQCEEDLGAILLGQKPAPVFAAPKSE